MDNYMSFGGYNVIFWYTRNEKLRIFRLSVITNIYPLMRTLEILYPSCFNCCSANLLATLSLLFGSNGNFPSIWLLDLLSNLSSFLLLCCSLVKDSCALMSSCVLDIR